MDILIATTNPGKVREFQQMLAHGQLHFHDLSAIAPIAVPQETGQTFRENACLKAGWYARHAHQWTLADDSGLQVDALGGSPGIYSARWAELHNAGHGDADNNALLLQQLQNTPDNQRTARFVCILAISNPDGQILFTTQGTIEGRILHTPRGDNGFGYDPLFLVDGTNQTSAQLSPSEKNAISHRGQALKRLRKLLHEQAQNLLSGGALTEAH